MKLLTTFTFLIALTTIAPGATQPSTPTRFTAIDIYIDTHTTPLAAWQLNFSAAPGSENIIRITGIEGADPGTTFAEPPYYDPKAIQNDRVILAAFTTQTRNLPTGKTRVATIHLLVTGGAAPNYNVNLTACADSEGSSIDATVTLKQENAS